MSRQQQFIAGFVLLAVLIVVLLVTGLMRSLVVVPVLYIIWVGGQLLDALPQPLLWGVVVFVGVLIALRSLPDLLPKGKGDPEPPVFTEGKVMRLTRWFQNASEGEYFRKRLLRDLLAVALAAEGREETINEAQIAALLRSEELGLPEHVRQHLMGALRGGPVERQGGGQFFASATPTARKQIYDAPEVIDLIEHLEQELEIHHYER
jgi:hypothetical protein